MLRAMVYEVGGVCVTRPLPINTHISPAETLDDDCRDRAVDLICFCASVAVFLCT